MPRSMYLSIKALARVAPKTVLRSTVAPEDIGNLMFTAGYPDDPLAHPCLTARAAVEGYEIGLGIMRGTNESNGRAYGRPLLLMHGTDDRLCDIGGSRMFAKIHAGEPGFNYIEWQGYMHEIHNGGPGITGEEAIKKIRDFRKE